MPTRFGRIVKSALSVVLGILAEFAFVFWFIIIAWGTALVLMLLWQLVS